jgi:HSP20 family protein
MSFGAFEALESLLRKRQEKSYAQLNRIARHQLREATNPNKLIPNVDLSENRECIRVMVDLPGVLAKDIDVTIDNGVLCIEGSRKITDPSNDAVCIKKQRFIRRYAIDTDVVDCANATAVLSNGVMTFRAPKKARKQVVRVPVVELNGNQHLPEGTTTSSQDDTYAAEPVTSEGPLQEGIIQASGKAITEECFSLNDPEGQKELPSDADMDANQSD